MRIAIEEFANGRLKVSHVAELGDLVTFGEDLVMGDAVSPEQIVDDVATVVFGGERQIHDQADVDVFSREGLEHMVRGEQRTVSLRHSHVSS